MTGYAVPKSFGTILNANERPDNLPETIRKEIAQAVLESEFNRYPDTDCKELLEKAAKHYGVQSTEILAGCGSDQMLGLVIGRMGQDIVTLDPDFSMYDFYAAQYGGNIRRVPAGASVDDLISAGKTASMVLFSNPNNPTGTYYSTEDIAALCAGVYPVPVVCDEAYVEFAPESALPLLAQYDNLYVTRTLSKAMAGAALRCGFLISNEKNIDALLPYVVPYALSSLTQKAAGIVLDHADALSAGTAQIIEERERMQEELEKMNIRFSKSQANFICLEDGGLTSLANALEAAGICIRRFDKDVRLRITVGRAQDNDNVLKVIRAWKEKADAAK